MDVPQSCSREEVDDEAVALLVPWATQTLLECSPLRLGPVNTTRPDVLAWDVNAPASVVGHEVRICQPCLTRGELGTLRNPEGQLIQDRHPSLLLQVDCLDFLARYSARQSSRRQVSGVRVAALNTSFRRGRLHVLGAPPADLR